MNTQVLQQVLVRFFCLTILVWIQIAAKFLGTFIFCVLGGNIFLKTYLLVAHRASLLVWGHFSAKENWEILTKRREKIIFTCMNLHTQFNLVYVKGDSRATKVIINSVIFYLFIYLQTTLRRCIWRFAEKKLWIISNQEFIIETWLILLFIQMRRRSRIWRSWTEWRGW